MTPYEKRKAAGLCVSCGKKRDRADRVLCAVCREKRRLDWQNISGAAHRAEIARQRDTYRKRAAQGMCPRCGKEEPLPGRRLCPACAEKARQYYHQKRKERKK